MPEGEGLKDGPSSTVKLDQIAYTWSFSKYKLWKTCQERYVREYVMGRRPPFPQKPFFQGKVAHKLIELGREAYAKGETDNLERWCLDNLDREFDAGAQKILDWGPMEIDLAREEAKVLAAKYASLVTENGLLDSGVHCEYNIGSWKKPLLLDNGLRLTGFIDWFKSASDDSRVLDGKTYKSTWWLDKDQLVLYAIAAEAIWGVRVTKVAWLMIRTGKTIWMDVTPQEKTSLMDNLLKASQQVAQMDIKVFPNFVLCGECPHTGECDRSSHWIIDAERMEVDF